MELRPLKLSLDFQHDPRVIPIKQQLLQDYFSRTQTARPDFTTDAKVLKVPATQFRQQLNYLTFENGKKREYLMILLLLI